MKEVIKFPKKRKKKKIAKGLLNIIKSPKFFFFVIAALVSLVLGFAFYLKQPLEIYNRQLASATRLQQLYGFSDQLRFPGMIEVIDIKANPANIEDVVALLRLKVNNAKVTNFYAAEGTILMPACSNGKAFTDDEVCADIAKAEGFIQGEVIGSLELQWQSGESASISTTDENGYYDAQDVYAVELESLIVSLDGELPMTGSMTGSPGAQINCPKNVLDVGLSSWDCMSFINAYFCADDGFKDGYNEPNVAIYCNGLLVSPRCYECYRCEQGALVYNTASVNCIYDYRQTFCEDLEAAWSGEGYYCDEKDLVDCSSAKKIMSRTPQASEAACKAACEASDKCQSYLRNTGVGCKENSQCKTNNCFNNLCSPIVQPSNTAIPSKTPIPTKTAIPSKTPVPSKTTVPTGDPEDPCKQTGQVMCAGWYVFKCCEKSDTCQVDSKGAPSCKTVSPTSTTKPPVSTTKPPTVKPSQTSGPTVKPQEGLSCGTKGCKNDQACAGYPNYECDESLTNWPNNNVCAIVCPAGQTRDGNCSCKQSEETDKIDCGKIDVDDNDMLNYIDLAEFAKAYNKQCKDTAPTAGCKGKDTNSDGKVNYIDLQSFAGRYHTAKQSCSQ